MIKRPARYALSAFLHSSKPPASKHAPTNRQQRAVGSGFIHTVGYGSPPNTHSVSRLTENLNTRVDCSLFHSWSKGTEADPDFSHLQISVVYSDGVYSVQLYLTGFTVSDCIYSDGVYSDSVYSEQLYLQ